LKSGKTLREQRGVRLQFYDKEGIKVAETLSEFDGYYSYLGLKPGKYSVRIDDTQLKSLNFNSLPAAHQVMIKVSEFGDILDGLDFILSSKIPKKP
jgi:hypothetical protein